VTTQWRLGAALVFEVGEVDEDVGAQPGLDALEQFEERERVASRALFGVLAGSGEEVAEGVQDTGSSDGSAVSRETSPRNPRRRLEGCRGRAKAALGELEAAELCAGGLRARGVVAWLSA
jgi:hypothetical protein